MDARPTSRLAAPALSLCCAVSGGAHAALVPDHAAESAAAAWLFAASALVLIALAVALERNPSRRLGMAAAAVLAGLLVVYAASRLTVVWPLDHSEPVDPLGATT